MIRQQEETEQKKENERQRELKLLEFLRQADEIETLILDPEKIDPAETEIICPTVGEKLDKAPEA